MKKIWNDPVWSKVIAGAILGGISLVFTFAYAFFGSNSTTFYDIINSKIEVNLYVLVFLATFLVAIATVVFFVQNVKKYDIFFSAPMSFENDVDYKKTRENCLSLINIIKENTPYKNIYYAAEHIENPDFFSPANHAAIDDIDALRRSKRFFLYMPKKMPTSCVFEAGYALRKGMPTVYFCHHDNDLPFLMRDLNDGVMSVRKYRAKDFKQLEAHVKNLGTKIFKAPKK